MASLPLLPGMSFTNPAKTDFRKSQAFGWRNGVAVFEHDKPGVGGELLPGQKPRSTVKARSAAAATLRAAGQEYIPAWVAFDRQVLRFYAYFLESVVESRVESYRIRKCQILYYLEDDTMQVVEPKVENSGIPQGTVVKRHRMMREGPRGSEDEESFYTVHDLNVGIELPIYGRVYRIVGCDEFTKTFMAKLGIELGPEESFPEDPYTTKPSVGTLRAPDAGIAAVRAEKLKFRQFLENDRKVLRFFARWDDRGQMFGDVRTFQILVFLADNTVAVNEMNPPNSGRDPFPQFVKRQKLPKVSGTGTTTPFYTASDFMVGQEVEIFGRVFFIYDCDPFTRTYTATKLGIQQPEPVVIEESAQSAPQREVPPYTGYGTEEDSLGSVAALVPKPPKKDFQKMMVNDGKILRFGARMVTDRPEDLDRRFTISYYLADDTFQIFEPPQRNTGLAGGKFLERCKTTNAPAGRTFIPSDFYVGARIEVFRRQFEVLEADEYALNYMEQHPDEFPMSDGKRVTAKARAGLASDSEAAGRVRATGSGGDLSTGAAFTALQQAGMPLHPQELVTLVRCFAAEGQVDMRRLTSAVL